jgi:hypothetical protein
MVIRAEVHSDDMNVAVKFDATPWFEAASDMEIFKLAECGVANPSRWGGEPVANEVARYMESKHHGVAFLFQYLNKMRPSGDHAKTGYECFIAGGDAVAWVKERRPRQFRALTAVLEVGEVSDLPVAGEPQFWDTHNPWTGDYANAKPLQSVI